METIKSSIITFFGKPNVGKSTLFNALQNNVYAIATKKAQTTRNNLIAKVQLSSDEYLILIDTPGFHKTQNKLDLFLNSEVKTAIKQANVACFIADPTREINDEDIEILNYLKNIDNHTKILIINKADLVTQDKVETLEKELNKVISFDQKFIISASLKTNLDQLKNFFISTITNQDINLDSFTEPTDDFIAKEIIREACLLNLKDEVPHAISVVINQFKYDNEKNLLNIDASIYTERESQKGIIVGKAGSMIKKIGIDARKKLLDLYDCKINLQLYVKTKDDWRNNDELIKQMGYKK